MVLCNTEYWLYTKKYIYPKDDFSVELFYLLVPELGAGGQG